MIFCAVLLFFSVISTSPRIIHTLHAESVVGGDVAEQSHFRYHVTILGKEIGADKVDIICNGGFVREDLVLSVAACFLDINGKLKQLKFLISAGTNNVADLTQGMRLWIEEIYIPRFDRIDEVIDASISKLNGKVSFELTSLYSKLNIPIGEHLYEDLGAVLVGCECLQKGNHALLRYIQLEITKEEKWKVIASKAYITMRKLALKFAQFRKSKFDLCEIDEGSPIVVGTTVVGLALKVYNQSAIGRVILYTDAYLISDFIAVAMEQSPDPSKVLIFDNNAHFV